MQKRTELNLRQILIEQSRCRLVAGLTASAFGYFDWANWIWAAGTLPVLAVLTIEIVSTLRHGDVGLDIVAFLSMSAALIFGEQLAACVVALMYAGGQHLENFAEGRARREMTALLSHVPRNAVHRNGKLKSIPIDELAVGDRLLNSARRRCAGRRRGCGWGRGA